MQAKIDFWPLVNNHLMQAAVQKQQLIEIFSYVQLGSLLNTYLSTASLARTSRLVLFKASTLFPDLVGQREQERWIWGEGRSQSKGSTTGPTGKWPSPSGAAGWWRRPGSSPSSVKPMSASSSSPAPAASTSSPVPGVVTKSKIHMHMHTHTSSYDMLLHPVTYFCFIFVFRTPSANSMELQLCLIWYLVSFSLIVILSPLISPLKDPPVPHMLFTNIDI